MKRKFISLLLVTVMAGSLLAGCGDKDVFVEIDDPIIETKTTTETESATETQETIEEKEEESHEGMYRSELTNEWIDEALQDQRPAAIIVDNEKTALDHYGLTQADIIYEIMNSTANGEITRLMCLVKDYDSLTQFGSIRSVRPTHLMIAPEYNAILVHDGGPFYINSYLENPWVDNLSGGFARIQNGKPREFTEYVTTGEIAERIAKAKIDVEYNDYYKGSHFTFADEKNPIILDEIYLTEECTFIDFPFPHNKSQLEYDKETDKYYYSEYGAPHIDLENDKQQLSFTNVLIQCVELTELDQNGYMQFDIINAEGPGYYITGGQSIPVTWTKTHDTEPTRYYASNGKEITLNTGKTYIAFVSSDRWDELVME